MAKNTELAAQYAKLKKQLKLDIFKIKKEFGWDNPDTLKNFNTICNEFNGNIVKFVNSLSKEEFAKLRLNSNSKVKKFATNTEVGEKIGLKSAFGHASMKEIIALNNMEFADFLTITNIALKPESSKLCKQAQDMQDLMKRADLLGDLLHEANNEHAESGNGYEL